MSKPELIKFVAANSWGNCRNDEFIAFLSSDWCKDADVIALSEVFHTPHHELDTMCWDNSWKQHLNSKALLLQAVSDEYHHFYTANSVGRDHTYSETGTDFKDVAFGNLLFVHKKNRSIWFDAEVSPDFDKNGFQVRTRYGNGVITEVNGLTYLKFHFHGLWLLGNTKGNSPFRDQQSANVLKAIEDVRKLHNVDRVVFGGDMNLDHDTTALQMFVDAGYRNLNVEFGINNTRTPLYREYGKPGKSMHADYMFACKDTVVTEYHVPDIPISDHRPLIVKFF